MEPRYRISQLIPAIKGKELQLTDAESGIDHLLLDSRKLLFPAKSLFFAIVGDRLDGHNYIAELYQKGVRNFVLEKEIDLNGLEEANVFLVDSGRWALQRIARFHRERFSCPVIGITGSNGKTIVKEWLYQMLSPDLHIVRSPKSYNSQIGVPLSVWLMESNHELGIFEAGISEPDEMIRLEPIIQPHIGIFTNIGEAHNEGFLNKMHKTKEKLRLFLEVDTLIYCRDYNEIHQSVLEIKANLDRDPAEAKMKTLTWSFEGDADVLVSQPRFNGNKGRLEISWKGKQLPFELGFSDKASVENQIHCIVLMLHMNYAEKKIQKRLSRLGSIAMRLELRDALNNCSIINDSYNSDIGSFEIAIDFLRQQNQHKRKTVILSDILQSGKNPLQLYDEVASILEQNELNRLIAVGPDIAKHKARFKQIEGLQSEFHPDTNHLLEHMDLELFQDEAILIKGARPFRFNKLSRILEKKVHATVLEVNLGALTHNLKAFQSRLKAGVKTMVMVKAFSYGSGSHEIANTLQFNRVDYLAVAYADEGIELRNSGIKLPIMVMNPDAASFDAMIKFRLEPEIYSFEQLDQFLKTLRIYMEEGDDRRFPIHLILDTGMRRLGFETGEVSALIEKLKSVDFIRVESIFTHLVASESEQHDDFTREQLDRFSKAADRIIEGLHYPIAKHALNTSGILRFPEAQFDMVRLGIGLYGVDGTGIMKNKLREVSRLRTTIAQIKEVGKGESIGYGRHGKLGKAGRIATVGIGYADGYSRRLGNGVGHMILHGKKAPTVGHICMDMCMLDLAGIPEAKVGDEVLVFGEELPIETLASWGETISYEVLTGISGRVKRVYLQE